VSNPDPVRSSLDSLRRERERRGLSFDDVARLAKIPARYVKALEENDEKTLPQGPFRNGYRKQYLEFLGLDEQDLMATERAAAPELPLARLVAGGFAATVLLVVVLRVGASVVDWVERPAAPEQATAAAHPGSQVVGVRAVDTTKITVRVDGGLAETVALAPGENRVVRGDQRVEIDAQDLTRVVVTYNGEHIEPLGNISRGRRLVFVAGD
jgi:transcriptional regulator with XRE-family HTH domain